MTKNSYRNGRMNYKEKEDSVEWPNKNPNAQQKYIADSIKRHTEKVLTPHMFYDGRALLS